MSEPRLYIAMRSDLGMGRGKEIGQAIHAYRSLGLAGWSPDMAVICVRANSEAELVDLIAEALGTHQPVASVRDAGRTHNEPGTLTCAAIGPIHGERGPLLAAARLY